MSSSSSSKRSSASGLPALVGVALSLMMGLVGCDTYTCEGACGQYYGQDGCGHASWVGKTREQALDNCTTDCGVALYTTTQDETSGLDDDSYARLQYEVDAVQFIRCVVDKDYSEAVFNQTCQDVYYDCPWIRW